MPNDIITVNGLKLWYETFGKKTDPAILLMMGNSAQGIMWTDDFCKQLASQNRFIIRYDYRDTGLSSCINYDNHPYSLYDLMSDAIGLLDVLEIQKAHFVGLSMGGALAQLMAIYHSERVLSITCMMSSPDLSVKNDAFKGKDTSKALLPPPKPDFVQAVIALNSVAPKTRQEKITQQVANWRLANGDQALFDEFYWNNLIEKAISREELNPTAANLQFANHGNHSKAQSATPEPNLAMLKRINVPMLIIHGKADPIFPPAHAEVTANEVPDAKLLVIDKMGHALSPQFFHQITQAIISHTLERSNRFDFFSRKP